MHCVRLVMLTLLAALALAAPASAAPGVVQDLDGCRTSVLPANDDVTATNQHPKQTGRIRE